MCTFVFALQLIPSALLAAEVTITFPPSKSTLAGGDQTFVIGKVSPPATQFEINGVQVTPYRTGSFLTMMPVTPGKNTLRIKAGSREREHIFYLPKAATLPFQPRIEPLFPARPSGVQTGQSFSVRCKAPANSAISAQVGERVLVLKPEANDPTLYSAELNFSSALKDLPVTFFSATLPDAPAGTLSALAGPVAYTVTGKLFETQARPATGANAVHLPPDFNLLSTGYAGSSHTVWLENAPYYVDQRYLKQIKTPAALTKAQPLPDLGKGFGPHPPKNKSPRETLIVLDAGHGGSDPGAIGPSGLTEKKINLIQVRAIEKILKAAGYQVLLTRVDDTYIGLYDRVRMAYNKRADAFISIHYNSCASTSNPQERRHISTYVWNEIGKTLGRAVHSELEKISPARSIGVQKGNLAVCRNPAVPSILIELDFITAPEGEELIQSTAFQQSAAEAILKGLRAWSGQ